MRRPTSAWVAASWLEVDELPRNVRVTTAPAEGTCCILPAVYSMRITRVTALTGQPTKRKDGMAAISANRAETEEKVSLRDLCLYFFKLGTFGFGGPIALAGYMQRDLQQQKGWIT